MKEPAAKVWESQDDMQSLLDTFRNLNAEKVDVETAPDDLSFFGLDKPVLTVTVTIQAADAAAPSVLGPVYIGNVCADDDHFRFARVEGRTQIYRIKQTPVSAVRKALRGVIAE